MDDLTALRIEPRDAALVRRLGRRLVPTWGFIVYGALYLWLAFAVGFLAMMGTIVALGDAAQDAPLWFQVLIWAVTLGAFVLSWWPFARWIKWRRGDAYRLFAHGRFVDAHVVSGLYITVRGAPLTRAKLAFADGVQTRQIVMSVDGHRPEIVVDAVLPALVEPSCRYSAVFIGGRPFPAR